MIDQESLIAERLENPHLRDRYDRAIFRNAHLHINELPSLERLVHAAPFYRYGYIEWLIALMAKGDLKAKNLDTAEEYLWEFESLKDRAFFRVAKLPRHIAAYDSLQELCRRLQPLIDSLRAPAWLALEMQRAKEFEARLYRTGQARLVADTPDFKVVQPLSAAAACFFEDGAQWCTGDGFSLNYFYQYVLHGNLLDVIVHKTGKKYGLDFGALDFVDKNNQSIELDALFREVPGLEEVLRPWLRRYVGDAPAFGKYLPERRRDYEFWYRTVEKDGALLEHVPPSLRTKELCRTAIDSNGNALAHVPPQLFTSSFFRAAVARTGEALRHVPEDRRSAELCFMAVRQDGMALKYVPYRFRSEEMYLAAVSSSGFAIQHVPLSFVTPELCRAAVQQTGIALRWVPAEFRTHDLCLAAVRSKGFALEWVPKGIADEEIYMAAVEHSGYALQHIPALACTLEHCWEATKNGVGLQYVPEDMKTYDLCFEVVQKNGLALQWVPKEFQDHQMCLAAVRESPGAVHHLGVHHKHNPELYLVAALVWRVDHLSGVRDYSMSFPQLPHEFADEVAHAAGIRFDEQGDYYLVPVDMEYADYYGVEVPQELMPRNSSPQTLHVMKPSPRAWTI